MSEIECSRGASRLESAPYSSDAKEHEDEDEEVGDDEAQTLLKGKSKGFLSYSS